jgi:hypothetical protein
MKRAAALLLLLAGCATADGGGASWRPLFNGKDLSGWETYLGSPKKGEPALGLDHDPTKVFSAVEVDGAPAIRISGEFLGAVTTKDEFENYHFRVEFKWGVKRWPPRENDVRDSGILYHCVGPHGAGSGAWMKSLELNIEEKDCGDYWAVAGAIADMEGDRVDLEKDGGDGLAAWKKRNGMTKGKGARYRKGAEKMTLSGGWAIKDPDAEKPTGDWNVIELFAVGQTCVHVVNGKVVMILTGSRHKVDGKEVPLTRGRIQLQSEWAEVFYRKPEVRPIAEIPKRYLE